MNAHETTVNNLEIGMEYTPKLLNSRLFDSELWQIKQSMICNVI